MQPVFFISHGGGPWPWIQQWEQSYSKLRTSLHNIPSLLEFQPKVILMISAHWITRGGLGIMNNPRPPMLYDYYGFPPYTYSIHYNAPGHPQFAKTLNSHLKSYGFETSFDSERGLDHGAFVPLAVAFPEAQIPVVQLSIEASFDPNYHLALGEALKPLRGEGVLIIGSGLTFHNMHLFNPEGSQPSEDFDAWLQDSIIGKTYEQRKQSLINWEMAPSARVCHPLEDHLTPLMVAVGAAGSDEAQLNYYEQSAMGGVTVSGYKFG